MSWDYGRLATEVYELDKPVGRSFGALEYYARQLAGVTGRILEPATEYDPAANQTNSFLRYEKWHDGGLVATELQRFRLQSWSLPEFGHLLADAGFAEVSVTADHQDDHQPGPDSYIWTFHAVRPR